MSFLRRTNVWLLATLCLASARPVRAADIDKYLPQDTQFLAVFNVRQLLDAPAVKKQGVEELKTLLKGNAEVSDTLEALGFDPFRDLTSITVAAPSLTSEPKGIIIVHGSFDVAKFEAKAEKEAKDHGDALKILKDGDHKIYEVSPPNGDKPVYAALVDKTTIVAAPEKKTITEAFAKASGKASELNKEAAGLIEKQDQNQFVWMLVRGDALRNSELAKNADDKLKDVLKKTDLATFGMSLAKELKVAVTVTAKGADDAKEVADFIKEKVDQGKGFLTLFAGNMPALAPLVDVVNGFKITRDGNTVTLKGEVSQEAIEKAGKKDQ
jgi:hypothetical protein